ncbi:hypothetical protein LV779_02580 [Streptomyces thinghirensis]|nr:hypothetical protein [Streptomyces thinghirensis]
MAVSSAGHGNPAPDGGRRDTGKRRRSTGGSCGGRFWSQPLGGGRTAVPVRCTGRRAGGRPLASP